MSELMDRPPSGFVLLPASGAFLTRVARFYVRDEVDGRKTLGTRITEDQTNSEGFAHGGFLLAFADVALSYLSMGITLTLTADFIRPVRISDWIEATVTERKRSRNLIFVDAVAACKGRPVLRISGLFRPFKKVD